MVRNNRDDDREPRAGPQDDESQDDQQDSPAGRRRAAYRPGQQTATQRDILIGESKRDNNAGYFDPLRVLAEGSDRPEYFLPMGNHTARSVARDMRIIADENIAETGEVNLPQVMWTGYQMSLGIGRQAREDLLRGIGARREMRDRLRGMYDRFSGNEGPQRGDGHLT